MNPESPHGSVSLRQLSRKVPGHDPASNLWVLTGSVGAIDALRIFLGLLPESLPVAFVLSLHIADSGKIGLWLRAIVIRIGDGQYTQ